MNESCASTLLEQGEENCVAISVPIKLDEQFALNSAGCGIIPMEMCDIGDVADCGATKRRALAQFVGLLGIGRDRTNRTSAGRLLVKVGLGV